VHTSSVLTWKERLAFRESELMRVGKELEIVTASIQLPKGVTAWGAGRDTVRALSLIVTREDAIRPDRLIAAMDAALALRCETVIVSADCYEVATRLAIERARTQLAINSPQSSFRSPTVEIQLCARHKNGDHVWIVSTSSSGGVQEATISEVHLADNVVYTLTTERGDLEVPQSDVFSTSDAAKADADRFSRAIGRAIHDGTPRRGANDDAE
jgi:hypothetical protein